MSPVERMRACVRGHESALKAMIIAWCEYARAHKAEYNVPISKDGFLGPEWLNIGRSLRDLLNGHTGRLDCGTVDALICDTIKAEGFDHE